MTRFSIAAAALAAVIAPAMAIAATHNDAPSREISLRGYDLSDPNDRREIEGKIDRAARQLCDSGVTRTLSERGAQADCVAAAKAKAMGELEQRASEQSFALASQ